jgi:hypothetical protein
MWHWEKSSIVSTAAKQASQENSEQSKSHHTQYTVAMQI